MNMLRRAFDENTRKNIEILAVYDNPRMLLNQQPRPSLVVEMVRGRAAHLSDHAPAWFHAAMRELNSSSGNCSNSLSRQSIRDSLLRQRRHQRIPRVIRRNSIVGQLFLHLTIAGRGVYQHRVIVEIH